MCYGYSIHLSVTSPQRLLSGIYSPLSKAHHGRVSTLMVVDSPALVPEPASSLSAAEDGLVLVAGP